MRKKIVFGFLITIAFVAGVLLYRNSSGYNNGTGSATTTKTSTTEESPKSNNESLVLEDAKFPDNFFFGTASSDFQTTGGNGLTDWNIHIENCVRSQKCYDNDTLESNLRQPFVGPGEGALFLERYKEDFSLAGQIGIQVHRLSLEWARIEPEEGKFNHDIVKKYRDIFLYMKSMGVEPMICLNHFALPLWFAELGGWENPKAAFYYSRYAEFVAKNLGLPLEIKWWLTFNEPQIILVPYTKGIWPPNKPIKNYQDQEGVQRAIKVASNIIDAHRLSYRAIHKILGNRKVMVSYASAPGLFYPHNPESSLDQTAYNIGTTLNTLLFDYSVGRVDRDFVGLNYYGRVKLKFHVSLLGNILPWLTKERPFAIQWEMPFDRKQGPRPKEFYPKALYDLILKFRDFNLPIVITENGLGDADDKFREEFLVIHLKAIHDAIRDGVPVIGYQYWALTDTWEWDGFFSQMGLISIDRENNLERKLRPSAITYGEIIKTHTIKKELLEKHKELLEAQ